MPPALGFSFFGHGNSAVRVEVVEVEDLRGLEACDYREGTSLLHCTHVMTSALSPPSDKR